MGRWLTRGLGGKLLGNTQDAHVGLAVQEELLGTVSVLDGKKPWNLFLWGVGGQLNATYYWRRCMLRLHNSIHHMCMCVCACVRACVCM